jgi:hypothetical protein
LTQQQNHDDNQQYQASRTAADPDEAGSNCGAMRRTSAEPPLKSISSLVERLQ